MPTDAFGRFGALMREGGANISVIGTDQWQLQVAATLVGLKRASDDIKAMYAPDDAQAAHVYALAVADDLDENRNLYCGGGSQPRSCSDETSRVGNIQSSRKHGVNTCDSKFLHGVRWGRLPPCAWSRRSCRQRLPLCLPTAVASEVAIGVG